MNAGTEQVNILISSAGKRVSLLREFRAELHRVFPQGKVFATELCPEMSPAAQVSDRCFRVPRVTEPGYADALFRICADNDVRVVECPLREDFSIDEEATAEMMRRHRPKLTFFCSPNNPSGNSLCRDVMLRLAALNEGITVVDEAYIDFTDKPGITLEDIRANDRIVVLRTLSKAWALAGARIGIMLACDEILEVSYNVKYPYNISRPAATEAIRALSCTDAFRRRLEEEKANRAWLMEAMRALPIVRQVLSSDANFFLARFDEPRRIYEELKGRGIVLRDRSGMLHCDGCLRITVGSRSECEELVRTLEELCS